MTRRELLAAAGAALCRPSGVAGADEWSWEGDLAVRMMDGAHRLVDRKITEMPAARVRKRRREGACWASSDGLVKLVLLLIVSQPPR